MSKWIKSRNSIFIALFLSFWTLILASGLFAVPSQTEWFVAGTTGDDSNPGSATLPLASVHRVLSLIRDAYASEAFDTAIITVSGGVYVNDNDMESNFVLEGGIISSNTAESDGGGMFHGNLPDHIFEAKE